MDGNDEDMKLARAIGKTFTELERAEEHTRSTAKLWNERLGLAHAALRATIQREEDGSESLARAKLAAIGQAFQMLEETEAGRKTDLHLCKDAVRGLRAKMRKQIDGLDQLELFGS